MSTHSNTPAKSKNPSELSAAFAKRFGGKPRIFRAPGRVNLIGEHTDYNDGFVLPAAIDQYTWTAVASNGTGLLRVFSENLGETATIDLAEKNAAAKDHWSDYVHGVAVMLRRLGIPVSGADIEIYSNVPSGAGLSSSAALEVSVASALLACAGKTLDLKEVAQLCQRAENEFVGARVGIMDQFASCFGSADHAILLDCRSLEYKRLPLPAGVAMVICNTMVKHEHSGSGYNDRRSETEEGVRLLKKYFPAIRALRDVSLTQLEQHVRDLPPLIYRRCHHVISEDERVLSVVAALPKGDMLTVGKCMAASHASLRDDYEVSCRELDVMVEIAARQPGVIGARMTGGGFGGCTINLVRAEAVDSFRRAVAEGYAKAMSIEPEIYVSRAGAGVMEVSG